MIVTETGFRPADPAIVFDEVALDCEITALDDVLASPALKFNVPSFADGRAFTLARQLRMCGFKGIIRVVGNLLPDQFAMARRAGIDEIEITEAHAARCQEAQWLARANWRQHDYQHRLRSQPFWSG
jgi:uncharacterized protein (DUF934 family)